MIDQELSKNTSQLPAITSLFSSLACAEKSFCEAFASPGQPREHWGPILEALESKGISGLKQHHERARNMLHEDGATINPFDDPGKRSISWALDLVPLPISAGEWSEIESGIIQRATLLEKILADTYGPRELMKKGMIPAELYFANPNFLHSCCNIVPPGNRFLTFYSADLYRGVDGRFRVFRDLGGPPAGLGYALENRIIMSRVFSELYHKTQIHRLAPFFKTFHQALIKRTLQHKEDPGIVLLSPGPDSPTYFEHALLSRYLGYPLVEAQDLTVRNGRVFLKKLAGLEPVEAIFRHISDSNSDPFALKRETPNGIAGLIQVCRERNIDIVSPVGSSFINTPALSPFLSSLCHQLLGDELILPGHPAWWCGNPDGLSHVLSNRNQLNLGHAFDTSILSAPPADWQSSPLHYIAAAPLQPSSVPAWNYNRSASNYCMLRVFACATDRGFAVMPGGLAITASDAAQLIQNNPDLQQSKDVWVMSDKPVGYVSLMEGLRTVPEFKRRSDLPSRVADHLLWLGRYLERAEGLVRLLRSVFRRLSGEDRLDDIPELPFFLKLLRAKNIFPSSPEDEPEIPLFQELYGNLLQALYQRDKTGSVVSTLKQVQVAARRVRDRLSLDSSRIINHLEDLAGNPSDDPLEFLDETLFTLSAFSGLAMESMTRSLGWRFMDMGRRLERAIQQTNLISIGLPLVCGESRNTLEALLEVSDSTMTYRARYRSAFQLAPVLDLLLVDESNPKSLAFQFSQIYQHVEHLPHQSERSFAYEEERIALKMLTAVRLLDLTEIKGSSDNTPCEILTLFLSSMSEYLNEFSQEVTGHYLTRVPATPHFTMLSGDNK